ncbi:hypothetical protein PED39_03235 [Methanomassiliicoccales archaeon LGM-RCC1]|nr:hypothetical protein PED39_03235 [Methanomassiliicoccales archaeon LGM-RCC1]
MLVLILGIAALLSGYLFYSRLAEKAILPYKEPPPAISMRDGIDYVPMKRHKNLLIQFLNIAGTGPIFGALMGAKWGPIVFLWIIFGTIFGGAVHDYMTGMMSMRNGGASVTGLIKRYLGERTRYPILILIVFLMVMVSATFARSASDLLVHITGVPMFIWMAVILIYFMASTVLPIDKLIGKIYPLFGTLLLVMAAAIIIGLAVQGYTFPGITLENLHPTGAEYYPDMFITVACGAISGFHATQSPMIARCTTREKDGRMIFYGAMCVESVVALIWATAGLTFYGDTGGLTDALAAGGSAGVVYEISMSVAGPIGGILAIIGVIICPITSGDTAMRSARLMIQDDRQIHSDNVKATLSLTIILSFFIVGLCLLDFSILWQYFSWLNQTLACIVLWTATVFLLRTNANRMYSLITALPAIFMTMTVTSFIMHSGQGFSLDYTVSLMIAAFVTVAATVLYVREYASKKTENQE